MEAPIKSVPYERTRARKSPTHVDTVEQKRSRRLSKPRTSSSGKGHLKPNLSVGDLNLLTKSPFMSNAESALSPTLADISVSKPFSKNTLDPSQTPTSATNDRSMEKRRDGEDAIDAPAKIGRLQRTGTMFVKRIGGRRSLIGKSTSTLALNELGDEAELKAESYEWIKDKAEQDRMAMKNHDSLQGSEDNAESKAPIRRKSLLTPGVATRGTDVLRKLPVLLHNRPKTQADVQTRYYNPGLSSMSPLARIAGLDVPSNGSRTSLEVARADTPAELDYGRLGILRITNGGAVSPALTERTVERQPPYTDMASLSELRSEVALCKSDGSIMVQTRMSSRADTPIFFDPYSEDAGNPWLEDAEDEVYVIDTAPESHSTDLRRWPTVTSAYSQPEFEGYFDPQLSARPVKSAAHLLQLDPSYPQQLPSLERPLSALEPTSKTNEDDAMLFEEEPFLESPYENGSRPSRASLVADQLDGSQLAMSRILESMMAASRLTPLPQREEEIERHLDGAESPVTEPPLWSAVDSGYGSSTGFRSPHKGISPASSVSQGSTSSEAPSRPQGPRIQHTVDTYEGYRTQYQPRPPASTRQSYLSEPARVDVPAETNAPKPLASDSSSRSPENMTVARETETPKESRQDSPVGKKLQKRPPRPKSMPPPVDRIVITGCTNANIPLAIPSVPAQMAARNAERWGSQPFQEREPTLPIIPIRTAYATEPRSSRSPGADSLPKTQSHSSPGEPHKSPPPVPFKSTRRRRFSRSELIQRLQQPWTVESSPIPTVPELRLPTSYIAPRPQRPVPLVLAQREAGGRLQARPATATVATFQQSTKEEGALIDWEKYRRVWRERRKSAGEALKQRPDFESIAHGVTLVPTHQQEAQRCAHRHTYTEHQQRPLPDIPSLQPDGRQDRSSSSSPLATSPHSWHASAQPSPLKVRREERDSYFPGRFDGGLAFQYEHGKGVGGSAGTRGTGGLSATRRTGHGDLAKGFGVDLSDVPVFVSRG